MTKINAVREWVELAIVTPGIGGEERDPQRGDLISVAIGQDDERQHEVCLSLTNARALRNELSEMIYDLELLEDEPAQTSFEFEGVPTAPYERARLAGIAAWLPMAGSADKPVHTDTEDGTLYFATVEEFVDFLERDDDKSPIKVEFAFDGDVES